MLNVASETMPHAIKPGSQSFIKKERLTSKKLIEELFRNGTVKKFRNLRFHYRKNPSEIIVNHQVLFSVPIKNFKKATERNRIKRQLRECFRRHKSRLYANAPEGLPYLLGYVYISSYLPVYKELEKQVIASIDHLINIEFPKS